MRLIDLGMCARGGDPRCGELSYSVYMFMSMSMYPMARIGRGESVALLRPSDETWMLVNLKQVCIVLDTPSPQHTQDHRQTDWNIA